MESNNKAQGGLAGLVSTLVVVGILLIIGVFVFTTVDNSIDTTSLGNGTVATNANSTIEDIEDNFFNATSLAVVALIVLAASVIIGILLGAFRSN